MIKVKEIFSSFSVDDLEKAKKFYGQTLGLKVSEDTEMKILNLNIEGGSKLMIYPKPNHKPASFTVLNLPVDNVEKTVDDFKKKGIHFETYNEPDLKTNEKGIVSYGDTKMAWFKDPSDNIISVIETKQ